MPSVRLQHRLIEYEISPKKCWEVTNFKPGDKGYFLIRFAEGRKYLHRLSYQTFKGELIKKLLVRHLCNNSLCINPEHLEQGTDLDNNRDTIKSGNYIKDVCKNGHDLTEHDAFRLAKPRREGHSNYRVCRKCEKERNKNRGK